MLPKKKKTIAQLKKECKEKGLVYDNVLKDCRERKKKGKNNKQCFKNKNWGRKKV